MKKKEKLTGQRKIKSSKNTNIRSYSPKSKTPSNNIERKRKLYNSSIFVVTKRSEQFLKRMQRLSASGYFRENMFGHELIWNGLRYNFEDKFLKTKKEQNVKKRNRKHLFIFSLVKSDAEKYIKNNDIIISKFLPSNELNIKFKKHNHVLCGTDIDGAYWRIAWQLGIIREKTYQHGLRIDNKEICLAALASLGSDKSYRIIENGEITNKIVTVRGSQKLKEAYTKIRYTCFLFMQQLALMLKNDFYMYKTDCIFYVKTDHNINMVNNFLDDHELDHKMMENPNKRVIKSRL